MLLIFTTNHSNHHSLLYNRSFTIMVINHIVLDRVGRMVGFPTNVSLKPLSEMDRKWYAAPNGSKMTRWTRALINLFSPGFLRKDEECFQGKTSTFAEANNGWYRQNGMQNALNASNNHCLTLLVKLCLLNCDCLLNCWQPRDSIHLYGFINDVVLIPNLTNLIKILKVSRILGPPVVRHGPACFLG